MLKVEFRSGLTGEPTSVIVNRDGSIVGDSEIAIDGFYNEDDNMFLLIETVENALIADAYPDTWQQLYIGLPDGDMGEAVISVEYIPDPLEILEDVIRELNLAANDDVNTEFLKSMGRTHNPFLSALGIRTIKGSDTNE